MIEVGAEVARLAEALEKRGDPQRAVQEKRYLRSPLRFHGASVPAIRAVAREWARGHAELGRQELVQLAEALWSSDWHEQRFCAIELLAARGTLLTADDLPMLERMLRESGTWACVDSLAANVVGDLVERFPVLAKTLERWARDEDFWIRRSALLALLVPLRNGGGDFDLFRRLAVPMLHEKEFFIRKAIGWVLREVSKRRPELVVAFVREHRDRMSPLTLREATKRLPADVRA